MLLLPASVSLRVLRSLGGWSPTWLGCKPCSNSTLRQVQFSKQSVLWPWSHQGASQCQELTSRKVTACLPGFVRAWALVPVVLQLASRRKAVWRRGWKRIIQTNLLWHIKYESVEQPVQAWRGQQEVGEGAHLLGALWRGGWQELPTLLGCTLPTERRLRIDLRQNLSYLIWQQCLVMLD